jgi:hypothetical protein
MNKEIAGSNLYKEPITVVHADMEKVTEESIFRSFCPVCKEGLLMVGRDQRTLKLRATDNCILCGQRVVYSDIKELIKKAGEQ